MKKRTGFLGIGMALLIMVGCSLVTGGKGGQVPLATVRVALPVKTARAVDLISLDDAIAQSDTFSLKATRTSGSGGSWGASATDTDGFIEMQVPEGTYNFVMGAGKTSNLLLATGYVTGRAITPGALNTIEITLRSIDILVEVPSSIEIGENFNAAVTIDYKNPLILQRAPAVTIRSVDTPAQFASFTMTSTSYSQEAGVYTYTYAHLAPVSIGSALLALAWDVDDSISGGGIDWYIRNSTLVETPIDFSYEGGDLPPRVAVTVTWGDD